ncbi:hypothetical protein ACHAPJ_007359 [Fusarium lateritium]
MAGKNSNLQAYPVNRANEYCRQGDPIAIWLDGNPYSAITAQSDYLSQPIAIRQPNNDLQYNAASPPLLIGVVADSGAHTLVFAACDAGDPFLDTALLFNLEGCVDCDQNIAINYVTSTTTVGAGEATSTTETIKASGTVSGTFIVTVQAEPETSTTEADTTTTDDTTTTTNEAGITTTTETETTTTEADTTTTTETDTTTEELITTTNTAETTTASSDITTDDTTQTDTTTEADTTTTETDTTTEELITTTNTAQTMTTSDITTDDTTQTTTTEAEPLTTTGTTTFDTTTAEDTTEDSTETTSSTGTPTSNSITDSTPVDTSTEDTTERTSIDSQTVTTETTIIGSSAIGVPMSSMTETTATVLTDTATSATETIASAIDAETLTIETTDAVSSGDISIIRSTSETFSQSISPSITTESSRAQETSLVTGTDRSTSLDTTSAFSSQDASMGESETTSTESQSQPSSAAMTNLASQTLTFSSLTIDSPISTTLAATFNLPIIGQYTFAGCLGSAAGFPDFAEVSTDEEMSTERCVSLAAGNRYIGIYQGSCFAADSLIGSAFVSTGNCDLPCPGDGGLFCGGTVNRRRRHRDISANILLTVYAADDVVSSLSDDASRSISSGISEVGTLTVEPGLISSSLEPVPSIPDTSEPVDFDPQTTDDRLPIPFPTAPGPFPTMRWTQGFNVTETKTATTVTTVVYTTVDLNDPTRLITTEIAIPIGYAPCNCAEQLLPPIDMTTVEVPCHACGSHGEDNIVLTIPAAACETGEGKKTEESRPIPKINSYAMPPKDTPIAKPVQYQQPKPQPKLKEHVEYTSVYRQPVAQSQPSFQEHGQPSALPQPAFQEHGQPSALPQPPFQGYDQPSALPYNDSPTFTNKDLDQPTTALANRPVIHPDIPHEPLQEVPNDQDQPALSNTYVKGLSTSTRKAQDTKVSDDDVASVTTIPMDRPDAPVIVAEAIKLDFRLLYLATIIAGAVLLLTI